MVRKVVAAMRAHAEGDLSLSDLEAAIRGERRLPLPLAEPERLVLWEVRHGVRWTVRGPPRTRAQRKRSHSEDEALRARREVMRALASET
jgi:tRNA U38,U39,U40 pseudouridine synthase TruA